MIAYYFRVMEDGTPTGWRGLVVGVNMEDIFWGIDEYVDPYAVEIKPANSGGYCRYYDETNDQSNDANPPEFSEWELMLGDKGWKTPKWRIT